jgi:glucokinase
VDEAAGQSIVAIDLGGTQIRAAHLDAHLHVADRHATATGAADGPDAVIARIIDLARAVLADARAADREPPVGVGISSPGPLDPWHGIVGAPPNLPGWHDVPLAARIEAAVGLPTFLERDTNVAMMAEWRHGAARGADDAVYVTISTGIGGGIVANGRPLIGRDGTAGEIGHLTVQLDGPLCADGMPGHAEAIGSGAAIAREGRALLESGTSPGLLRLTSDPAAIDAALVARAADEGDAACREVLDHAWDAIGAMCAGLVNVLNPEVIVLGGGIGLHRADLRSAVRAGIDRRAFATPARRVRVEIAEHADDVSLVGLLPIVNERLTDPAYRRSNA